MQPVVGLTSLDPSDAYMALDRFTVVVDGPGFIQVRAGHFPPPRLGRRKGL